MTVKELVALLNAADGDTEVVARCKWHGESPPDDQFRIQYVTETLEPDTGESVVMLECRQDG